jgi:hypothetical protein
MGLTYTLQYSDVGFIAMNDGLDMVVRVEGSGDPKIVNNLYQSEMYVVVVQSSSEVDVYDEE